MNESARSIDSAFDADVLIIGSGFGGSVAALRFAEAGRRVVVLERGDHVRREDFEADADMLWKPRRHRFGMNDLQGRGDHVIPWLGAAVGGGSHVFAATLKRRESFDGFPRAVREDDLAPFYEVGESMLDATPYPDYPPYSRNRATQLLFRVGEKVAARDPELVESFGPIRLAISFAPEGGEPGGEFVNQHGARQRYSDPGEQKILGGDIGVKNSLDRNYLFRAEKWGARIEPLCEADRIEPLESGGYRVHFRRRGRESSRWQRFLRHWLPSLARDVDREESLKAGVVVVAAGAVGSSELLLRNRDLHRTLAELSPRLGEGYSSNGDSMNLVIPFRALPVSWLGLALAVVAWPLRGVSSLLSAWLAVVGAALYFGGLATGGPPVEVDIGTTNSDYIRFRHRDGSPQGSYVEGGRYPTPLRGAAAAVMSALGLYRPHRYRRIVSASRWLRRWVPPFALIARSWPLPLLQMGRDDAVGRLRLDGEGRAVIDYPLARNREYYAYLDRIGKLVARCADAWWLPNLPLRLLKRIEVPHNLGGVPMGESADNGVVDHAGRVFGHDDLVVLDGSIIPVALGPNPALTILALAERALSHLVPQLEREGSLTAESGNGKKAAPN